MPALGTTKDYKEALGITLEDELRASKQQKVLEDSQHFTDVNLSPEQAIELCRIDPNFLQATAMPSVFKFEFPPVLLAIWQLLVNNLEIIHTFPQLALGIPRGFAKTTLIKLFVLWLILFTKVKFILVIAETENKAVNIITDIIDMLNEPNIIKLFGDWKIGSEIARQDLKKFGFRGRTVILAAIGAEGSLRGMNIKNERPEIMVFDDIQSRECADSILQSDKLERWLIGTAMKAKSPHGCMFIFAGNMYPTPNSILKKLKTNSSWIKFISGAILSDGSSLWPEFRPVDTLIKEFDNDIAMGHPEIFLSEVMNDTDSGVNTKINLSAVPMWPFTEQDNPQGKFVVIDPSTDKKSADLVAIGYFEVYDEIAALKHVTEEALSPLDTIKTALLYCLKNNCRVIGVESTAYQYTLLFWFNHVCKLLGIEGIYCVELHTGSFSKNSRIANAIKGLIVNGDAAMKRPELWLHPNVRNLVFTQIANWNPLKRDNVDGLLDLCTYGPKMIESYGALLASDETNAVIESSQLPINETDMPF